MYRKEMTHEAAGHGRAAVWALVATAGLFATLLVAAMSAHAQPAQDDRPTKAFLKVCSDCHEPDRIMETKRTRGGWEEIVEKMVEKGASGSDEEFDLVMQYLLGHYGMVNVNQASLEDIALVLGLTEKEADAVVAYRRTNGNFKNFDALAQVPGIDAKKLEAHKASIMF